MEVGGARRRTGEDGSTTGVDRSYAAPTAAARHARHWLLGSMWEPPASVFHARGRALGSARAPPHSPQPANSPATGEREGDGEEKKAEHLRERSGAPWLREGGGMTASARRSLGHGARVGRD